VIFNDEGASRRQLLLTKGGQQGTNIGAATDRLQRIRSGFLAQPCLQIVPHALGGRRERLSVGLFATEFGDRLIQAIVLL
jgi:hypothetical protein